MVSVDECPVVFSFQILTKNRFPNSKIRGNKEGSYTLRVGDGRERKVQYVADAGGFRASIKTNEPGIVASNPASVNINTAGGYTSGSYSHQAPVYTTHVGGYSSSQGGKFSNYLIQTTLFKRLSKF